MAEDLICFSAPPAGPRDEYILGLAKFLRPCTSSGVRLVRVGGQTDGGYVMNDDLAAQGVISIGVGRDVTWDMDIAKRGLPVVAYDHTVRSLPKGASGIRHLRVGVGSERGCRPFDELLDLSGFSNDLILKVDVEGAEWAALSGLDFSRFTQILIELHDLDSVQEGEVRGLLASFRKDHVSVHVHANNYAGVFKGEQYWFPRTVEVTLSRRDRGASWLPSDSLHEDLDRPCDPRASDISLRGLLAVDPA